MGVYILSKKTRGVAYLYAVQTHYTIQPNGTKKRTQSILKSFGRLDRLIEKDPDIVAKLKEQYGISQQQEKNKEPSRSS